MPLLWVAEVMVVLKLAAAVEVVVVELLWAGHL
jgi:hypothetical protein